MVNGKFLFMLRSVKGMKQSEVARKLGVSQQAYSKLERSTSITEERLEQVLVALNSSREQLDILMQLINE